VRFRVAKRPSTNLTDSITAGYDEDWQVVLWRHSGFGRFVNMVAAGLLLRRPSVLLVVFARTRSSAAAAPNSRNGVLPATWVAKTFVQRF